MSEPSPQLFFVTGAPRSGTTFVSDWISQDPHAYCVHEILEEGDNETVTCEAFLARLLECAATGSDRLGKRLQREFMRWNYHRPRESLRLLGLKEPVVWRLEPPALPHPLGPLFARDGTGYVVVVRHPFDVVASGRVRAMRTRNWPGFGVAHHCELWTRSVRLLESWRARGLPTLCLVWEELVSAPGDTKRQLESFLGLELPLFDGYELERSHIRELRRRVDRADGLPDSDARALLSTEEFALISSLVEADCELLGYRL